MQRILLFIGLCVAFTACQSNTQSNEETAVETEVPAPELPSNISTASMRLALGLARVVRGQGIDAAIERAGKKIVKGIVENGEGTFDVYKIMADDGEELANIYCIENESKNKVINA